MAEALVAQLEWAKKRGGLEREDGELTTSGTQAGEDNDQLLEILREKDSIIDAL